MARYGPKSIDFAIESTAIECSNKNSIVDLNASDLSVDLLPMTDEPTLLHLSRQRGLTKTDYTSKQVVLEHRLADTPDRASSVQIVYDVLVAKLMKLLAFSKDELSEDMSIA